MPSKRLVLSSAAVAIASVALVLGVPADAGQQNTFTVVKQVDGQAPAGAVFDVQVECTDGQSTIVDETVQFDESGNPLNTNSFGVPAFTSCTATETETNGATVEYECEVSGDIPVGPGGPAALCSLDDQTVAFGQVDTAQGTVTVVNEFGGATPPPPPDVAPDDPAPDVIDASPAFTG